MPTRRHAAKCAQFAPDLTDAQRATIRDNNKERLRGAETW